jgi:hypothetical protein
VTCCYGARQNCGRRFLQAFAAHFFGYSGNYAIRDGLCGFRRIVTRADSGAARGENEINARGMRELAQLRSNGGKIIGDS